MEIGSKVAIVGSRLRGRIGEVYKIYEKGSNLEGFVKVVVDGVAIDYNYTEIMELTIKPEDICGDTELLAGAITLNLGSVYVYNGYYGDVTQVRVDEEGDLILEADIG